MAILDTLRKYFGGTLDRALPNQTMSGTPMPARSGTMDLVARPVTDEEKAIAAAKMENAGISNPSPSNPAIPKPKLPGITSEEVIANTEESAALQQLKAEAARLAATGSAIESSFSPTPPPFNPPTPTTVNTGDLASAYANPSTLPSWLAGQQNEIVDTGNALIKAMQGQPTAVSGLESARLAEGYGEASANFLKANAELNDIQSQMNQIEDQVREDLGPGVSESWVKAEALRRSKALQPALETAKVKLNSAQAALTLTAANVDTRLAAVKEDAARTVNVLTAKLGLQKDNITSATNLLTSMKNFELLNDYQKNQKRDSARAIVATLMASTRGLSGVSDADIAELEAAGQWPEGSLKDIRDNMPANSEMISSTVDDAGNLNALMYDKSTGTYSTKRFGGFAVVAPKVSAESIAYQKLYSNASDTYKAAETQMRDNIANALSTMSNDQITPSVVYALGQSAAAGLQTIAARTGNPADKAAADAFLKTLQGSYSETSGEQISGKLNALTQ